LRLKLSNSEAERKMEMLIKNVYIGCAIAQYKITPCPSAPVECEKFTGERVKETNFTGNRRLSSGEEKNTFCTLKTPPAGSAKNSPGM